MGPIAKGRNQRPLGSRCSSEHLASGARKKSEVLKQFMNDMTIMMTQYLYANDCLRTAEGVSIAVVKLEVETHP